MPRVQSKKRSASSSRPAPKSKTTKAQPVAANAKASFVLGRLIHFQTLVKLHHFQTRSYAMHKATDALYLDLVGLIDALFEQYQGAFQSFPRNTSLIIPPIPTISDGEMLHHARGMQTYLKNDAMQDLGARGNSGIQASVDDIYDRVSQFIYLLEFK